MTVTVCTVDEFRALPPGRRRYPSELCLLAEPAPYAWLERDCLMPVSQRYGTVLASYGYLHMSDGRFVDAHRGMWERRHGPIPDGLWVLHRCDNPPCCEDSHLYLGTALDNMRDVSERGRSRPPFGEMSGAAKLTSDAVRIIRQERAEHLAAGRSTYGLTTRLADEHGVSVSTINAVWRGDTWRHVT